MDKSNMGGHKLSNTMKETPRWYQHFTLKNLPTPPTLDEQRVWASSSEYKQQANKPGKFVGRVSTEDLKSMGATTLSKLAEKESQAKHNLMSTTWTQKMLSGGTLADKISALSLQIKYQPLSFAQYFDSLLALGARKGHKETNLALETLRDLFMTDLLPLDRKLRFFHEQPWIKAYSSYSEAPHKSTIPPLHQFRSQPKADLLALFYLEDFIKKSYGRYIETISDQLSTSNMKHIKNHRVKLVFELLAKIPEQENNLLVLIINKFGDSDRAIVSKVQFHLEKLVKFAPALKLSVIKEIERIIFRPHIKQRTQYFAILFITNLILDKNDFKLAQYLLTMYLTLFQIIINDALPLVNDRALATQAFIEKNKQFLQKSSKGKKAQIAKKKAKSLTKHKDGGISTKILGAILTGVARCLPYALPSEIQSLPEHLKTEEQKAVESVLVAQIDQLIHCAASTAQTNGNVCVQSLALTWQILSVVQSRQSSSTTTSSKSTSPHATLSRDPFYRVLYSIIQFPQPFTCSRVKIFFNVLFKAIKADTSKARVLAIVKRLIQTAMTISVQASASALYIVSNVAETHQFIYNAVQSVDKSIEIQKQDIMTSLQYNQYLQNIAREEKEIIRLSQEGTVDNFKSQYDFTISNAEKVKVQGTDCFKVTKVRKQQYDPFEGDPVFSRADSAGLHELLLSTAHHHPTLQVWANNFFNGDVIQYGGDPIKDFTPIAFLDNWLRKGSKRADAASANIHQPNRLIVDPEVGSYIADGTNAFIEQFVPLHKNKPTAQDHNRYRRETEEAFADRLVEEELLRIGGRGKEDQFDYEDFDDFEGELGEGEMDWDDRIAFGEGEIWDGTEHLESFGDFDDEDHQGDLYEDDGDEDEMDLGDDDEDDSDFDESQLVSLDWDSLDPTKGSIDEISGSDDDSDDGSDDENQLSAAAFTHLKTAQGKQSIFAQSVPTKLTKKTSVAPTKPSPSLKKQPQKDIFADINVNDLAQESDGDDGSDLSGDDDDLEEGGDLRDVLDDDEAIAELLEEVVPVSKADSHHDKAMSYGLGGKQTGAPTKRKQAPVTKKNDKNTHGNQNKKQKVKK